MLEKRGYDLCIIGAGVAGALVAYEAASEGKKVIVVEAGKKFSRGKRLEQIQHNQILGTDLWPWTVEGRDAYHDMSRQDLGYKYTLNNSRIKGVGGSTLHWGGMINRFWPSDFNSAERWGLGEDWPIDYDTLEPYYCRAETEMGVSGTPNSSDPRRSQPHPMPGFPPRYGEAAWIPVAESLGISLDLTNHARNSEPYGGRPQCASFAVCNACPIGARYSADFHIERALATGNLELLTDTVARRIDVDDRNQVRQVRATTLAGEEVVIEASSYVVAAHAIESARLLLLSDIGNQSDQLGRNLMEHWYAAAGGMVDDKIFPGRIGFTTLESRHWYESQERQDRGAIKIEFMDYRDPLAEGVAAGLSGSELAEFDCEHFGHWVGASAEIEQLPNADSRVTLDENDTDMFGDPVPKVRFALSDVDRRTHDRAHEVLQLLLDARGCRDVKVTMNFARAHHHMGTCRMSQDPDSGVVDPDCKVHGIDNLYLAGASVFPTGGAHQPTLTIAALALRLADHLR